MDSTSDPLYPFSISRSVSIWYQATVQAVSGLFKAYQVPNREASRLTFFLGGVLGAVAPPVSLFFTLGGYLSYARCLQFPTSMIPYRLVFRRVLAAGAPGGRCSGFPKIPSGRYTPGQTIATSTTWLFQRWHGVWNTNNLAFTRQPIS